MKRKLSKQGHESKSKDQETKRKYNKPFHIDLPFDDAIRKIAQAKPPKKK